MMMHLSHRILAVAGLALAVGRAQADAQPVSPLSERAYEQIRSMAQEVDARARQANDPARHRRDAAYADRGFVRRVANFSRHANQFTVRLAEFRARPRNLDQDLRGLADEAGAVLSTLEHSRRASDRTVSDWDATANLVDQMGALYRADVNRLAGNRSPEARGDYGREGYGREKRNREVVSPGDDHAHEHDDPGHSHDDYGRSGRSGGFTDLARELADKSARLAESARQLSGPIPADARQRSTWQAMAKFAEQTRGLSQKAEEGVDRRQLKAGLDAVDQARRETDDQLKQSNVFPELRRDWAAAVQILERLRSSAGS
ncbi:MAG: hypothetical protein ABJC07_02930 [Acidobacteriota bacterium]